MYSYVVCSYGGSNLSPTDRQKAPVHHTPLIGGNPTPRSYTRFTHYVNDGSGRDGYASIVVFCMIIALPVSRVAALHEPVWKQETRLPNFTALLFDERYQVCESLNGRRRIQQGI